ncbi:DUF1835 domain-containing protein [Acanthopleuribacter pedis]|uniref:DUF1835 domain-containing protein n=1 Tax=Acanthopleuribacter pedis TaxID=442870 RepID=A0A8J7U3R3_9BACT|nr:DUF1835 domain-containing protein [Acanthopleuribacter pedis]MBO1320703.1 DUF1835 domain-containing protein [Acanthopleuribacter pedis]
MAIQSDRNDLHFVPSLSAAGSIKKAFDLEERNLISKMDQLSVGPLLPITPQETWRTERRRYWQRLHQHRHDHSVEALSATLYEELDDLSARCAAARHLVIWCSQSVDETVWTTWLIALFSELGVARDKVRLVFSKHPAFPVLPSSGILNPTDIRDNQEWMTVEPAQWSRLADYYAALAALSPHLRLTYLQAGDEDAWLAEVTLALLDFFPNHGNGLNSIDMRLLTAVKNGVTDVMRIIGNQLGLKTFHRHALDAAYLHHRLLTLADESQPFPALHRTTRAGGNHAKVTLTETGEALLNGEHHFLLDRYCEDWVAGTRIARAEGGFWVRREREIEVWDGAD